MEPGFFKNFRFYLDDPETGKIKIKYICNICGKEIEKPEDFTVPTSSGFVPYYHLTRFRCRECYDRRENDKPF